MQKTIAQVSLKNTATSTSPDSKMKPTTLPNNNMLLAREKYPNDDDYIDALEIWCTRLSIWISNADKIKTDLMNEVKYLQTELKYDNKNRPL